MDMTGKIMVAVLVLSLIQCVRPKAVGGVLEDVEDNDMYGERSYLEDHGNLYVENPVEEDLPEAPKQLEDNSDENEYGEATYVEYGDDCPEGMEKDLNNVCRKVWF